MNTDELTGEPRRIQVIKDPQGNTVQIGKDVSPEEALRIMGEGYDITLLTYDLREAKTLTGRPGTNPRG